MSYPRQIEYLQENAAKRKSFGKIYAEKHDDYMASIDIYDLCVLALRRLLHN